MRRAHRIALGGLAAVGVVALIVATPRVLPALPGFEVRTVEVTGTRLLPAREVLSSSGIRADQSVWDDPEPWERALERHPVVESARVTRRLPGTLRVHVREKRPVAFVAGEVLAPITTSGERLPIDPTAADADLPIVRVAPDEEVPLWLLEEAERLTRIDPELVARVSEIHPRDSVRKSLLLRHRDADILLPAGAGADRFVELRAVLADLERHTEPDDGGEVARIDLRFADQVVVRLPSSVQKP